MLVCSRAWSSLPSSHASGLQHATPKFKIPQSRCKTTCTWTAPLTKHPNLQSSPTFLFLPATAMSLAQCSPPVHNAKRRRLRFPPTASTSSNCTDEPNEVFIFVAPEISRVANLCPHVLGHFLHQMHLGLDGPTTRRLRFLSKSSILQAKKSATRSQLGSVKRFVGEALVYVTQMLCH